MRSDLRNHLPNLLLDYQSNRSQHRLNKTLMADETGDNDGHNIEGGVGGDIEGHMGGDVEGHMGGDPGSRFYVFVHRLPSAIEILSRWRNSLGTGASSSLDFSHAFRPDASPAPSAAALGRLKRGGEMD